MAEIRSAAGRNSAIALRASQDPLATSGDYNVHNSASQPWLTLSKRRAARVIVADSRVSARMTRSSLSSIPSLAGLLASGPAAGAANFTTGTDSAAKFGVHEVVLSGGGLSGKVSGTVVEVLSAVW